jgi:hypothetical protein
MDLGRLATCARCGKQFKLLLENHDEMRCIAALREENAHLKAEVERLRAALERIDTRARGGQDSTIVAALAALASIRQTARLIL